MEQSLNLTSDQIIVLKGLLEHFEEPDSLTKGIMSDVCELYGFEEDEFHHTLSVIDMELQNLSLSNLSQHDKDFLKLVVDDIITNHKDGEDYHVDDIKSMITKIGKDIDFKGEVILEFHDIFIDRVKSALKEKGIKVFN